jgi:RND family efflux transporter MFP subunit
MTISQQFQSRKDSLQPNLSSATEAQSPQDRANPQEPSPIAATETPVKPGQEEQPTTITSNSEQGQSTSVDLLAPQSAPPASRSKPLVIVGSILGLIVLLGGVAFGVWWFRIRPATGVTLYQVGFQNTSQSIGGGGIIYPRQQLDISYPVAERVVSVLVNAGDQVSPNQPLIQLDPSQLNVQIQQAANAVAAAQDYLNAVSTSGTAVNIAQAQQQYDLAKNKYNALVAQAATPLLNNGKLISPMHGVVTAVNVNPGEVFAADTPLLTLMDESIVIVHANIPLADLGQVHVGQSAIVTPSALPGLSFQGAIRAIISRANPQTDTFEVWVDITNTNRMLLPGMSAFVRIQYSARALVVPRLAVLDLDSEPVVFVVQNQHAYLRHVQVVGRSVNTVLIGQGLSNGDKVVLVGLNGLQDGQQVRVTRIETQAV